ncbi:RIP homotypic interaction motif-containing protein [Streptomyces sp. NPDC102384]|uniref:RIP homotypic interaction motif-containing protein n=1 Tax=Streptomyces sp. NPDC102384 TaxID=3366166 RepID=UPI003822B2D0
MQSGGIGQLVRHDIGVVMNGVELVVAALSAGATAGLTDTASSAVRDAYAGLRESVRLRLAARGDAGARVLEAGEGDVVGDEAWREQLRELLVAAGIESDEDIVAAARSLLTELGLEEPQDGVGAVDARRAQGVQIGDHNTMTNTFN